MNIPRYWAKGSAIVRSSDGMEQRYAAWRWSNDSLQDAARWAQESAERIARQIGAGQQLQRYLYGERAMREEVLQRVARPDGRELGVVTRNSYGALVLNAANAMFVDIDLPDEKPSGSLAGGLRKLFGAKPALSPEAAALQTLENWAKQNTGLGLRVYRTAGGLRALVTSVTFDPTLAQTRQILQGLDSDPLYIQLCQAQGCFRARLTPKPWRLDLPPLPVRWPFETPSAEARARQWVQRYEQHSAPVIVCRLVKSLGVPNLHPDVAPILDLHDRYALGSPSLRLA